MQNRRNLLKASAALAGGAITGFPSIARAQSARTLRERVRRPAERRDECVRGATDDE